MQRQRRRVCMGSHLSVTRTKIIVRSGRNHSITIASTAERPLVLRFAKHGCAPPENTRRPSSPAVPPPPSGAVPSTGALIFGNCTPPPPCGKKPITILSLQLSLQRLLRVYVNIDPALGGNQALSLQLVQLSYEH